MNAKNLLIIAALAVAGIAVGLWARGFSDARAWTTTA